jgi:large subunit ribosomal protein L3
VGEMNAIVGKKVGMTRVFDEDGTAIPVTVIEAQPNKITAIRRADRDGYDAVQLAGNPVGERKLSGGELGHLKKAGAPAMADLAEFRDVDFTSRPSGEEGESEEGDGAGESEERKVGDDVTVSDFEPGEAVKVSAVSVGKGFQGTIRRHGFQRGPVTHGSHNVRAPGSVGASADPSRVFPGQKMPGQMGARRATQVGAQVVEVDAEHNLLLIRGSVPGARNATVEVRSVG